ncbi:MAG: hypothetical protein JKY09_06105 [Crocinitomicaceae bacterium]|nr:hypothetical protein [Crocinitomicaceae bacterium]
MNSNRLYRIFESKSKLSRKDIGSYGSSADQKIKQRIETKSASSSFDMDAMEGWEQLSHDTSVMKRLDKKFMPKSYAGISIISAVIILGLTGFFALNYFNADKPVNEVIAENGMKEVITTLMEGQRITLDESDVLIPAPIENMIEVPVKEQIQINEIKDNFKEMKETYSPEKIIEIVVLPPISIEIPEETPDIVRDHKMAKEIYLHDLKLVDYRKYRSKPTIKTKQMVLTGTPANMEDQFSKEPEPIWRDVQIPYIDFMDKSVGIFSRGNYKKGLTRFETILETYSDDVNANFYAGLCLFNLGEYPKAIEAFSHCINGPFSNFDEEAQWMTALSYEKSGDLVQAKKYFLIIQGQNGFYANQAAKKVK